MNSAQKRGWRRENNFEIEIMVEWVNSPDKYVATGEKGKDGTIEMKKAGHYKEAFGKGSYNKINWRSFLLRMGIDESKFLPGATIVTDEITHLDVIM